MFNSLTVIIYTLMIGAVIGAAIALAWSYSVAAPIMDDLQACLNG